MIEAVQFVGVIAFLAFGIYALTCAMFATLPRRRWLRWLVIAYLLAMSVNGVVMAATGYSLFSLFPHETAEVDQ